MKIQQANDVWRNWSGSQFSAARIVQPSQISELQSLSEDPCTHYKV